MRPNTTLLKLIHHARPHSKLTIIILMMMMMMMMMMMIMMMMGISVDSTEWLFYPLFQVESKFGNFVFCGGGKIGVPGEKSSERDENQQQPQPTYDAEFGNRIRATLVGGECSHYCAIPAPLKCSVRFRPHPNERLRLVNTTFYLPHGLGFLCSHRGSNLIFHAH